MAILKHIPSHSIFYQDAVNYFLFQHDEHARPIYNAQHKMILRENVLIDAINQLDCRDKKKEVKVILSNFGDNSVDLKVLVWVPVLTHAYAEGDIKEVIYDTLNAHHIEIPFPQRDLHIIPTDPSTAGNSLPLSDDAKLTEEEKTALRKG